MWYRHKHDLMLKNIMNERFKNDFVYIYFIRKVIFQVDEKGKYIK